MQHFCNVFVTDLSQICHGAAFKLPSALMLSRTNSSLPTILIQIQCFAHWALHCIKYFVYLFCANRIAEEYLCFRISMVRLVEEFHFLWFVWPVTAISLLLSSSLVQTPITVASACIIVHWFSCALVVGSVVYSFGCILSYTLCGGDWTCGLFSLLASVLQNSKRNFYSVHFCSPHICNIWHSVGTCGLFSAAVRCRLLTDSPTLSFLAITLLY